jgi:hypothetical protein
LAKATYEKTSFEPAQGLPATKVGTFTQALYDEAKKDGWFVISMNEVQDPPWSRANQKQ